MKTTRRNVLKSLALFFTSPRLAILGLFGAASSAHAGKEVIIELKGPEDIRPGMCFRTFGANEREILRIVKPVKKGQLNSHGFDTGTKYKWWVESVHSGETAILCFDYLHWNANSHNVQWGWNLSTPANRPKQNVVYIKTVEYNQPIAEIPLDEPPHA